jgi:hypothetical protein
MVSNLHEDSNALCNIISFKMFYMDSVCDTCWKKTFFLKKLEKLEPINNYELLND